MYTVANSAQRVGLLNQCKYPATNNIHVRNYQRKHTYENEPWLFVPLKVSLQDIQRKRAEADKAEDPGSEFTTVRLSYDDINNVKRERFCKELNAFRTAYEQPIVDAYKEVEDKMEEKQRRERYERRRELKQRDRYTKKPKMQSLTKFIQVKDRWQQFRDNSDIGEFRKQPENDQLEEVLAFQSFQGIMKETYPHGYVQENYGHQSDWTPETFHLAEMHDHEIPHFIADTHEIVESLPELYKWIEELEYIYTPVLPKVEKEDEYDAQLYREAPGVPHIMEAFNTEYITEFNDIKDPRDHTLEELGHRMDVAFDNFQKRLFDPQVDAKLKAYLAPVGGGDQWPRFSPINVANKFEDYVDTFGNRRILLRDADMIRILKPQLIEAGLARVKVKETTATVEPGAAQRAKLERFEKIHKEAEGITDSVILTDAELEALQNKAIDTDIKLHDDSNPEIRDFVEGIPTSPEGVAALITDDIEASVPIDQEVATKAVENLKEIGIETTVEDLVYHGKTIIGTRRHVEHLLSDKTPEELRAIAVQIQGEPLSEEEARQLQEDTQSLEEEDAELSDEEADALTKGLGDEEVDTLGDEEADDALEEDEDLSEELEEEEELTAGPTKSGARTATTGTSTATRAGAETDAAAQTDAQPTETAVAPAAGEAAPETGFKYEEKRWKKPILEFVPAYTDIGTHLIPRAPRVARPGKYSKEVLAARYGAKLPAMTKKQEHEKQMAALSNSKYANSEAELSSVIHEEEFDAWLALKSYKQWHALWPHTQTSDNLNKWDATTLKTWARSDKWFPRQHINYNHNVEWVTRNDPVSPKPFLDTWPYRKVGLRVLMKPFNLSPPAEQRLKEIAGKRYDSANGVLKLTCDVHPTQTANKSVLKVQFRELLHEAWQADPNYISLREEFPAKEPAPFVPSEAAKEHEKPIIFKIRGVPNTDTEAEKLKITQHRIQSLSNPKILNPHVAVEEKAEGFFLSGTNERVYRNIPAKPLLPSQIKKAQQLLKQTTQQPSPAKKL